MFTFKQFTIRQDKTPMKVGTDGVLIGAWAEIESNDRHMLDIGCGTGLIALMLAQRSDAAIDAVEIDKDSAEQAAENVDSSKWSQRINIHNVDISQFNNNIKYDLIVSNPPYFVNSLLSPESGRSVARHTVSLSFKNLVQSVERLLSLSGRFSLILPYQESKIFEREAKGKLYLWRKCNIKNRPDSIEVKRVMCEYRLCTPGEIQYNELSIREIGSNNYTDEYKKLTADFYLKF